MKVLVSLSGGMDSATMLALARGIYSMNEVEAVGFEYGSNHNPYELDMARKLSKHYGVPFRTIDLTGVFAGFKSDLLGGEVPEGHYEAKSMSRTVVPGRNIIFVSILSGYAWSREFDSLYVGVHAGDHAIYPDCRPDFLDAMSKAIYHGTDKKIRLHAPFLYNTKADILRQGLAVNVPYQLTRTCYKPQPIACGKCGSCQERLEAFAKNDTEDPLDYESRQIMPKIEGYYPPD